MWPTLSIPRLLNGRGRTERKEENMVRVSTGSIHFCGIAFLSVCTREPPTRLFVLAALLMAYAI